MRLLQEIEFGNPEVRYPSRTFKKFMPDQATSRESTAKQTISLRTALHVFIVDNHNDSYTCSCEYYPRSLSTTTDTRLSLSLCLVDPLNRFSCCRNMVPPRRTKPKAKKAPRTSLVKANRLGNGRTPSVAKILLDKAKKNVNSKDMENKSSLVKTKGSIKTKATTQENKTSRRGIRPQRRSSIVKTLSYKETDEEDGFDDKSTNKSDDTDHTTDTESVPESSDDPLSIQDQDEDDDDEEEELIADTSDDEEEEDDDEDHGKEVAAKKPTARARGTAAASKSSKAQKTRVGGRVTIQAPTKTNTKKATTTTSKKDTKAYRTPGRPRDDENDAIDDWRTTGAMDY